jgi:hypothetical protein
MNFAMLLRFAKVGVLVLLMTESAKRDETDSAIKAGQKLQMTVSEQQLNWRTL